MRRHYAHQTGARHLFPQRFSLALHRFSSGSKGSHHIGDTTAAKLPLQQRTISCCGTSIINPRPEEVPAPRHPALADHGINRQGGLNCARPTKPHNEARRQELIARE
jgi:hypothetical protein